MAGQKVLVQVGKQRQWKARPGHTRAQAASSTSPALSEPQSLYPQRGPRRPHGISEGLALLDEWH